jgi:hypothetical protein
MRIPHFLETGVSIYINAEEGVLSPHDVTTAVNVE